MDTSEPIDDEAVTINADLAYYRNLKEVAVKADRASHAEVAEWDRRIAELIKRRGEAKPLSHQVRAAEQEVQKLQKKLENQRAKHTEYQDQVAAAIAKVEDQAAVVATAQAELARALQKRDEITKGLLDARPTPAPAVSKSEETLTKLLDAAKSADAEQIKSEGDFGALLSTVVAEHSAAREATANAAEAAAEQQRQ